MVAGTALTQAGRCYDGPNRGEKAQLSRTRFACRFPNLVFSKPVNEGAMSCSHGPLAVIWLTRWDEVPNNSSLQRGLHLQLVLTISYKISPIKILTPYCQFVNKSNESTRLKNITMRSSRLKIMLPCIFRASENWSWRLLRLKVGLFRSRRLINLFYSILTLPRRNSYKARSPRMKWKRIRVKRKPRWKRESKIYPRRSRTESSVRAGAVCSHQTPYHGSFVPLSLRF